MRLRTTFAPAAAALLVALAACGGGDGGGGVASLDEDGGSDGEGTTETTLSEEEAEEALLEWAECMRGEGIDVPDPQVGEDGQVMIAIGRSEGDDEGDGGGAPDFDAIEDAHETCGEPPAIGGSFTEEDRAEMEADALAFAECMREEGIEDFPDPDFSDMGPGAGPERRERRVDGEGGGAMIAGPFGEVDLSDPEVEAAFAACQDELGGPMLPAARANGSGGS